MDSTNELMTGRSALSTLVCNPMEVNEQSLEVRPCSSTLDRDSPEANTAVITIRDNAEESNADIITILDDEEGPSGYINTMQGANLVLFPDSKANSEESILPDEIHKDFSIHKCDMCGVNFASARTLSDHIRNHLGVRPYKCPSCDAGFTTAFGLRIHAKTHQGLELQLNYICEICEEMFPSTFLLERHRKRMHSNALLEHVCDLCNERFPTLSELHAHEKIHLKNKLLEEPKSKTKILKPSDQFTVFFIETVHSCSLCKKEYLTEAELSEHMQLHVTQWQHRCRPCNRNFGNSVELNMHNLQFHAGQEPTHVSHTCVGCGKTFTTSGGLKRHKKYIHGEFACTSCQKHFSTNKDLITHLDKSRKNKKKRKCAICNQEFRTNCQLSQHLRPNNIQSPFRCTQCTDAFAYPCALKIHRRKHGPQASQQETSESGADLTHDDELLAFSASKADAQCEASKALGNEITEKYIACFQNLINEGRGIAEEQTEPTEEIKNKNCHGHNLQPAEIKEESSEDYEEFEFIDTTKIRK